MIIESIRLALGSIRVNKLRSILTMLGIIIGISAVITITTIGNSMQRTIASTMNSLGGTDIIYAYLEAKPPEDGNWDNWDYPEQKEEDFISDEDIARLRENFEDKISSVLLSLSLANGVVAGEKYEAKVSVEGSTPGLFKSMSLDIIRGRDISQEDNDQVRATAVVSDLFVKYAMDGVDPIGKRIEITSDTGDVYRVYVVGVYHYDKKKFQMSSQSTAEKDTVTPVVIPYTYAKSKSPDDSGTGITSFQIMTREDVDPTALATEINSYFNEGKYKDNKGWMIHCMDMASQLGIINTVLSVITIAISIIAAISLIVGGVGVMNIMLVSVMERTREIGIRKAMGAKNGNVYMQFLTEAVVICVMGGIIGIIIGILNGILLAEVASLLIDKLATNVSNYLVVDIRPSTAAIVVSVVFSMGTGIVFGIYPAGRAAKMSPIDALRYE